MKQQEILDHIAARLGIEKLNVMQQQVLEQSSSHPGDLIIYSPTGTGKTLAYLIPLLKSIKNFDQERLQAIIVVPSRELANQIFGIVGQLATGLKATCVYGGHSVGDEKQSLAIEPSIIVATPGRLLDHAQRGHVSLRNVRQLVIDEFDKCLELGFEQEMERLCRLMPNLSRRILTSATVLSEIPSYVRIHVPLECNFLEARQEVESRMKVWEARSNEKDKLDALRQLLLSLPPGKAIVFANYRESVDRIYHYLAHNRISSGIYHGGLEQIDREKAITMFNNGSFLVLVTTDLGSRGLDIDAVEHIIHYHLPLSSDAYTHRNGRTARVNATGNIYILLSQGESLPGYIQADHRYEPGHGAQTIIAPMATLHFSAGRKEKISKGDLLGFLASHGGILGSEIGKINVHDHYSLVAVPASKASEILQAISPHKLKGKRVRVTQAFPTGRLSKSHS